ncbi:hypothetical protein PXD04_04480 [Methanosphaera sp. ISO3-F5]|uniref:hypothetical protein n=1 Tax=Methanosphaera sp. ISO3-F5 TaxID=1452353 RepID=UPI002B25DB11|nr:hypothetical protein [Methanosphaera sp. ISO3-F5]WQH65040.1 hypothetical protein PXD04_04480 [Methanosphaera sp. ISO3-F5]
MKETYEYTIEDQENNQYNIKCKVEYNTNNEYDTNYYFYDGSKWLKDFIDLHKLSPDNEEETKEFEDFITRVHDYMVHGNIWQDIKEIKDNEEETKESYKLVIKSKKI